MQENRTQQPHDAADHDPPDVSLPDSALLLDALPGPMFARNTEGRYLHVNRAFAEAMGRPADAIVGRTLEELHDEAEAARERALDRRCLETREPVTDGDSARGPLRDAAGRLIGVAGTLRSAGGYAPEAPTASASTSSSTSSSATPAASDSLESMLDVLPVAIYHKNADGTYAGVNAAFARMIGAPDPGAVTGRRDADFAWRALDHPKLDEDVVRTGLARHSVQRREVDRFARRRWTETSVIPQTDELGRVIGVVGIRIDVTAHRDELRLAERSRSTAERASRSKSTFLTQMSHELRTPLTSLLGFAELALEPGTSTEDRREHLERIRDNGWQVLALVDDLLDLSRIESGRLATRARAFSPREVITGLTDTLSPRLRASGLTLTVEIDDAVPEAITSDPIRFRQILANLVERARQEAGTGTVTLRASVSGRGPDTVVVVEVRDQGPTLHPDELERRLNPFDQDEGDTSGRGGLGLGLAIAWNLAELLEGRIDLSTDSSDGGTRFTLRLPIQRADSLETADWSPAEQAAHDPWQRVEAAARDGVAWFAPAGEELDAEDEPESRIEPAPGSDPEQSPAASASAPPTVPTPVTADTPSEPAATPAPEPAPVPERTTEAPNAGPARRILLAEDTPDTARYLLLVLRSRGHQVEHAPDGEAALAMHAAAASRGEPFDMVLTDVQMPRMDGHTLARRLRSGGWTGPIVALTAHATEEHRRDAKAAGCDGHVAKPLTPEALQELVQRHTGDAADARRAA